MQLLLFRNLWGVTQPWDQAFPAFKKEGFDGIETGLPDAARSGLLRELLAAHQFDYISFISTRGSTVAEHVDSFKAQLEAIAPWSPRMVNCHGGLDAFTAEQSREFFAQVLRFEQVMGVPVAFETHRGRILYNPWTTAALLTEFPDLKLCTDLSHWVCVCERLLQGCEDILSAVTERTLHIHARVGYEEGPQVPDPSVPEYQRHLEAHEKWWDMVWDSQAKRGLTHTTLDPEYGPPNYLHTLPHTNVPVANLWDICRWQAHRQRERFLARHG